MTTCYITVSAGTSNVMTTSVTTLQIIIEIKKTLKATNLHLNDHMTNRFLHSWSFHIKWIKLAKGSLNKCHTKWSLVYDPLCMLGNFSAFVIVINFFKIFIQEHYPNVKQFGSRSGPSWSGSKMFAKVIIRWSKSIHDRKKYRSISFSKYPQGSYNLDFSYD